MKLFLEDYTTYNSSNSEVENSSPYSVDTTPTQDSFSGDRSNSKVKDSLVTPSNKDKNVECYITQFPESGVTTRMQSSDDGDVSVGFSWDLD